MPSWLIYLTGAGWAVSVVFGWLWLGARDDVAREQQLCNAEKLAAVAEAQKTARQAAQDASEQTIAGLVARIERERKAREIAIRAASEAEKRPERVRTVIRRVADANSCIDMPVPVDILDSMRD